MTELIYQTDAYVQAFEARVTAVDGDRVALDRTAFYPGGGGQPNDVGRLSAGDNTWAVTSVKKADGEVWHTVEGAPPATGAVVTGTLDWDRRYALMRTHTAMHIMVGVVWRDYQALVTGGNMEPLVGRLDFEFEGLSKEMVAEIEEKLNAEVAAARPVTVKIYPRDEALQIPELIKTKVNLLPPNITEIRTVSIDGLDFQADGGTHVANTSEVGTLRVIEYKSKGKLNKRIKLGVG